MRLNALGRLTMNNPARERLLRGYVTRRLAALDADPARRTLVIGCGQGVDVELALAAGASEILAIDIDPRQVDRARRRLGERAGVTLAVGDVLAIDADDGAFDTVYDLGAVHLVPEWERAYAEIARVLRPLGALRFETIVGRRFRALMPLSTAGFGLPRDTGYTEQAVLGCLDGLGFTTAVFRPPAYVILTGLVGDLIGVATASR